MKSFFRFLGKHKLYAIVEILGLSIALTFVILMNSVVMDVNSIDSSLKVPRNVYALHDETSAAFSFEIAPSLDEIPEIESSCMIYGLNASYGGDRIATSAITSSFRDFFTLNFVQGGGPEATAISNYALISEELAAKISPNEDCVGKEFKFGVLNPHKLIDIKADRTPDETKFTVTGVFKDPGKTVLPKADLLVGFEQFNQDNTMDAFSGHFFIKLAKGIRIEDVLPKIQDKANAKVRTFMYGLVKEVRATRFRDIHFGVDTENPRVFRNITDVKLYNTFLYISLVILLFALMNYISLTVAFSRFRLTELATRRLLGEQQRSIHLRIILETATLFICALVVASAFAWMFKDKVGAMVDTEIHPLASSSQILTILVIVPLVTVIAGSISSFLFSRFKPIEIIKGEARYNDKTRLGKVFIAIQGAACIAVLALSSAILAQSRLMSATDTGYNIQNVLTVGIGNRKLPVEEVMFKVRSLPFVEKTGAYTNIPAKNEFSRVTTVINEQPVTLGFLYMDFETIDILGFRHDGVTEGMLMRESEYNRLKAVLESSDNKDVDISQFAAASTNDFIVGSVNDKPDGDYLGIRARKEIPIPQGYMVKVSGNEAEAVAKIRSEISSMGYTELDFPVKTMLEWNNENYKEEFRTSRIFNIFSLVCILLTGLAVLALSSYWTQMRTKDTAVRKIFGCSRKAIFLDTVKSFVDPVLIGSVIAIPLAWWYIGYWLQQYSVRIDNGILIYLPAIIIVLITVIAAISVQAVRLMNSNPVESIKAE